MEVVSRRGVLGRLIWVNAAIVGCLVMAVMMFASTIWHTPWGNDITVRQLMTMNHFGRRFVALMLLLVVWYLFKRRFVAWLMAVMALTASFVLVVPHRDWLAVAILAVQVFCLVTLVIFHRYFCRAADRPSVRRGVTVFVAMLAFIVLDAVVGRLVMQPHVSLWLSLGRVLNLLFVTGGNRPLTRSLMVAFWASFGAGILLVLRPMIFRAVTEPHLKARARHLVMADGQNSVSYLALEDDKLLFFADSAPGVVPYAITGDYVLALGDPICSDADFAAVLRDFYTFGAEGDYTIAFLGTTDRYLERYAALGFDWIKTGEEACFDLTDFSLAGSDRAKMRSKVNGATHSGATVREYRPLESRDAAIERAFDRVSADWLGQKKSGELSFTLGGVNLHDPMDRRYFYACDRGGRIVAFHVFLPYEGGRGYVVEVTRRLHDAPAGVTEKITAEAFLQFKAEGCLYGSLGVAPLSRIGDDNVQHPLADGALSLLYEKGNRFYGFKDLRRAKNKYGPTWRPAYWVFPRGTLTPRMIMAVIKVQNPRGIKDYLVGFGRQLMPWRASVSADRKEASS